jgi:hypothetical protein
MTTERDPGTRLVLSWLREDAHENAEHVLLRALDVVDTTPQRRAWWPARRAFMPPYAKLLAAAAAVAVVAVVGYNLLPGNGIGGPETPAPTATPTASAVALPSDDTASLTAGDYVTGAPWPIRITVTVPAGWHGHVPGPYYADLWTTGSTGGLYLLRPSEVAVDPCDSSKGFADVGASVDSLVVALQRMTGVSVTNVTSTTVAGYRGTALVVTAPPAITGCKLTDAGFTIWQNPLGGQSPTFAPGESIRVWVLDVAGQRLVICNQDAGYSATDRAQAQAVFDSIRIAPGG